MLTQSIQTVDRSSRRFFKRSIVCVVTLISGLFPCRVMADQGPIEFVRDVLPILKRSCYECHGPEKQKGDLRLDSRTFAFDRKAELPLIDPGKPENSELLRRVRLPAGDPEVMPARADLLSKDQIATLEKWILEGAKWPARIDESFHWAYQKPVRPRMSIEKITTWAKNDLDQLILQRLQQEQLDASPEAESATLLRRVYLDLIGLPPSVAQVDAFLQDDRDDAFERVVEQLLHSPLFGEKWARPWLDLARYADSHGFQRDDLRELWPYRDWVIQALNDDMPFDQFTIEQIAGDLLPNATTEQRIATGFNRCTTTNVEAGSDPEETRVNQIFDRVNTTGAVWLGTTIECAQCHDHKYDPLTQTDYYRLFAYFNSSAIEAERSDPALPGSIKFLGPSMPLSDSKIESQQARLDAEIGRLKGEVENRKKTLIDDANAWEEVVTRAAAESVQTHVLDVADFDSESGSPHKILNDKSVLLVEDPPDKDTYTISINTALKGIRGFKLEALTDPSLPNGGPARADTFVLNTFSVASTTEKDSSKSEPVALQNAKASSEHKDYPAANAIDDNPATAWISGSATHEAQSVTFETTKPIGDLNRTSLKFTLVQISGGGRTIGRLRLSALTGDPNGRQLPSDVAEGLRTPREQRTAKQTQRLIDYRMELDEVAEGLKAQIKKLEQQRKALKLPTTLVMQELDSARVTHLFQRGDYLSTGAVLEAGTPAVLNAVPEGPPNRLTLSRWLVSRDNPLTARVTVNRWWAELFGRGLVSTVDDFGIKGELPTHPELLDWLAIEFMDRGWSLKQWLRTVVTSATYRQSSRATPIQLERDPENKFYGRGPRVRLEAESIRDNALSIAGLISLKAGGPPIRPFQPDGLWTKIGGDRIEYIVSPGEDRYRRGIYVVWKRAILYPSFANFDASARLTCIPKRSRSNTPLQALTLLNDPVYVEAARALAKRIVRECTGTKTDTAGRIEYAVRLCFSRKPSATEVSVLTNLYAAQFAEGLKRSSEGQKLIGSEDVLEHVTAEEFAAWYSVASVLLNLDESITKE